MLKKNTSEEKDLNLLIDSDDFRSLNLNKFEEKAISKKMKIEKVIVKRLFSLFKFTFTIKSQENKSLFKEEIKNILRNTDGATFNIKKFMKNRKPYSPCIYFHDEEDFSFDLEEYSNIFSSNNQSKFLV